MRRRYKYLKIKEKNNYKNLNKTLNIDKNKTLKIIEKISKKNDEANKLLPEFRKINKTLDNADLVCTKTDGTKYDFNRFSLPLNFIENIQNCKITLDEAINNEIELGILINKLNNNHNPRNPEKVEEKERTLESAKKIAKCDKKDIIDFFEKLIFMYRSIVFTTKEKKRIRRKQIF